MYVCIFVCMCVRVCVCVQMRVKGSVTCVQFGSAIKSSIFKLVFTARRTDTAYVFSGLLPKNELDNLLELVGDDS